MVSVGTLQVSTNPSTPFLPTETLIRGEWNEWIAKLQYTISFELDIATVSNTSLECQFPFPLSSANNCICHSSLLLSKWNSTSWEKEDYIVGKVQEKKVATETYQDSIAENKKSSFLLKEEENQTTVDCYLSGLTVGNKYKITFQLDYITQAQVTVSNDDSTEYWMTLPVSLLKGGNVNGLIKVVEPMEQIHVDSTIQVSKQEGTIFFEKKDQEAQTHHISIQTKSLRQALQNNSADHSTQQPEVIHVEKGQDSYAVMIPIVTPSDLEADEKNESINSELIFVIDCSGSMYGEPLQNAVRTMRLFLQSLPLNQQLRINVTRFGSSFESVYSECKLLNDETYKQVFAYIEATNNRDLGGTDLYQPLEHIFKMKQETGYTKQVFILTDGELDDKARVLNLVKSNADRARVFTIGIGSCDRNLVRELAQFGNGYCEIVEYGEKMEAKVINHLKKALKPALTDCTLQWNENVNPCYMTIPPLFYGSVFVAIAVCKTQPTEQTSVTFSSKIGTITKKPFFRAFKVGKELIQNGNTIHLFGSWKKIQELWQIRSNTSALLKYGKTQTDVDKEIVDLSVQCQILSKLTSLVAVSEKYSSQQIHEKPTVLQYDYGTSLCATSLSYNDCDYEECCEMQDESECEYDAPKASFDGRVKEMYCDDNDGDAMGDLCFSENSKLDAFVSFATQAISMPSSMQIPPPSIDTLLLNQNPNGSWSWNTHLQQFVKTLLTSRLQWSMNQVEDICKKWEQAFGDVMGTLLAIAILQQYFADQKSEWELIEKKAMKWVKSQGKSSSDVSHIVSQLV